ncbi:NIL domain-containing protein, partial [Bacillus sp. JJ1503]
QETIEHLLEKYPEGQVVQLTFVGDSTGQPLITELIRKYDITVNILQGKISHTQNGSYGTLFIHLEGTESEVASAIEFIGLQQVGVEVIANG